MLQGVEPRLARAEGGRAGFSERSPIPERIAGRAKIRREDVAGRRRLSDGQKEIISLLFAGPVSRSSFEEKHGKAEYARFRSRCMVLNEKFRRRKRGDAVLKVGLDGSLNPHRHVFSYFHLNPEIFLDPPTKIPLHEVELRDVFGPQQLRIVQYLLKHKHATMRMMADDLGMTIEGLRTAIHRCIPASAERCGLGNPIGNFDLGLTVFFLTNRFLASFQLNAADGVDLRVLPESDRKIIAHLLEHPKSNDLKIGKQSRWAKVNAHCRRLGFGDAIRKHGQCHSTRYSLTEGFVELLRLQSSETHTLDMYFSTTQRAVLLYIAEHPNKSQREIAAAAGITESTLSFHTAAILSICSKNRIPKPIACRRGLAFCWHVPEAFYKTFRLPVPKEKTVPYMSETEKLVHAHALAHPGSSCSEIAKAVGLKENGVRGIVKRLVELEGHGVEHVNVRICRKPELDLEESYAWCGRFKARNGKWPAYSDYLKAGFKTLLKKCGGVKKLVQTLEERERVFASFGEDEQLVRRLANREPNAEGEAFSKYSHLARRAARRAYTFRQDAVEDAVEIILKGIRTFDYRRKVPLKAYLSNLVGWRTMNKAERTARDALSQPHSELPEER